MDVLGVLIQNRERSTVSKQKKDQRARRSRTRFGGDTAPDRRWASHASKIAGAISLYAFLRVLVLCAAFPFFNNVDEGGHMASIAMYSHGDWPGKELPHYDSRSARFLLYNSPEYLHTEEEIERSGLKVPIYQLPSEKVLPYMGALQERFSKSINYEAHSPPLYYLVGAGWLRLGLLFGLQDWGLLYWLKLLNPAFYAIVVWVSYRFAREAYPERPFVWLAVPALLAVFPQDVFFGLNRDVFSAPLAAFALWSMLRAVDEKNERRSWWLVGASFLVSIAFLVNVSNCVLYLALAFACWTWKRGRNQSSAKLPLLAVCLVLSLVTPALWMARNYWVLGDLTGTRAKTAFLGWTVKPVTVWIHHPIFSFDGAWYFLSELTQRFWRGEYVWHTVSMQWEVADWFYVLSSMAAVVAFIVFFLRERKALSEIQRFVAIQTMVMIFGSVLFMALISLPFDFHDCIYPSEQRPFFVSGRIIICALVPFILLYVNALDRLMARRGRAIRALVLACILGFITYAEVQTREPAFSSPYNFFALSTWKTALLADPAISIPP